MTDHIGPARRAHIHDVACMAFWDRVPDESGLPAGYVESLKAGLREAIHRAIDEAATKAYLDGYGEGFEQGQFDARLDALSPDDAEEKER
jgi:hypothetical protein